MTLALFLILTAFTLVATALTIDDPIIIFLVSAWAGTGIFIVATADKDRP